MKEDNLKVKAINGISWSFVDGALGQGVTFLIGIVLARLLSPSEYGLIGIVMIFTTIFTGIVDSGFSNALIRKKEITNDDYNTMFITNMSFSLLLYIILYFLAPAISFFFKYQELIILTRVMGLILIIQALSLTQLTILTKRIDFKTKAKASFVSATISGTIGIVMALAGLGIWALVGQQLSRQLLYTCSLWILNKWRPKFLFSGESFHYMWGFGWKLMVSGLLNSIWSQLYQVVVGKFYSPYVLGQYTRSNEYSQLFSLNFTAIIQRVTYPLLSEIQDNKIRLLAAYRKIIKTSMFVTAVIMITMGAMADPLLYCVIGPQWRMAASFLPYICISMSLYPLHAINLNMLQVQGKSNIFLKLEIIKKVIATLPLCLGIFVNIFWMLGFFIIIEMVGFFLNSYYTGINLGYSSWKQLKDIAPSYIIAFFVATIIYFLKYLPLSYFIILPLQITIGGCILILICECYKVEEYFDIKEIIRVYLQRMKFKKNTL